MHICITQSFTGGFSFSCFSLNITALDQKLLQMGSELMGVYVGVVGLGQIGHSSKLNRHMQT